MKERQKVSRMVMAILASAFVLAGCSAQPTSPSPGPTLRRPAATAPSATPTASRPTAVAPRPAIILTPSATPQARAPLTATASPTTSPGCAAPLSPTLLPRDSSRQAAIVRGLIRELSLTSGLPKDLTEEAYVYELIAPQNSPEFARSLGRRLGFREEPAFQPGAHSYLPQYEFREGGRRLTYYSLASAFVYEHPALLTDAQPPKALPASQEEAILIAKKFLEERNLLPDDCREEVTASLQMGDLADPSNPGQVREVPRAWQVVFSRRLDGRQVAGAWPSGAKVLVADKGEIAGITWLHREVAGRVLYPLRSVEEAWDSLCFDGPARIDGPIFGSGGEALQPFSVRIDKVELAYRESEVEEIQSHLQPFYRFSGTAQGEERGQTFPIALYVLAVAEKYLVPPPR